MESCFSPVQHVACIVSDGIHVPDVIKPSPASTDVLNATIHENHNASTVSTFANDVATIISEKPLERMTSSASSGTFAEMLPNTSHVIHSKASFPQTIRLEYSLESGYEFSVKEAIEKQEGLSATTTPLGGDDFLKRLAQKYDVS
jgi:hypothetical protein